MTRNFIPRHKALAISLCLCLLAAPACTSKTAAEFSPFPRSNEVTGWEKTGDVRAFPAADLWKYLDGEAERYLKAGVQTVFTADYRFREKTDAVVDIYRMATIAGAEQILTAEPRVNAEVVRLGDNARVYSQSLVFRKGACLVRITAYQDSPEIKSALLLLARGIGQRLAR